MHEWHAVESETVTVVRAGGQVMRQVVGHGTRRLWCAAWVATRWEPVHVVVERMMVAGTIVAMLTVAGEMMNRSRLLDVVAYALAELVTKVRLHR